MRPTLVNDFISSKDAAKLNSYLRSKATLNPHNLFYVPLHPVHLNSYPDGAEMHVLVESIIDRIMKEFKVENLETDRAMYQVLQSGDGLGYHTDAYGGVDGYDETFYSALLYLTDNYKGGEILFYNNNSNKEEDADSYKPKAGSLIYFKGDKETPHSVNNVISGERSNIILFYKLKLS